MKYLLKPTFLLFCVFILTSSVYNAPFDATALPAGQAESLPELSSDTSKEEMKTYNMRQQQIKLAVQNYFQNAINKGLIVGAGISIVKGDSVLLSNGYGKRKVSSSNKIDKETVFRLGSLSKGFAGVLAGKLKSESLLDWNNAVSDYVPEFNFDDHLYTNRITISHILSHTSGAPYHSYTDLVEGGVSLKKIAAKFKTVQPISEPGEVYSYQNAMFALSGEITQCITGNTINEDLENYFFKPLGMNSASTDFKSLMASDNIAYPHRKYRKGWRSIKLTDKYYNAVSAGGINASAEDMGKWMQLLLGRNEDIMTPKALSEVFTPIVKVGGKRKYYQRWTGHLASYYGYGWRIHTFVDEINGAEKTIIHHGGSVNDFRNEIAIFPDENLGICVLMNSMTKIAQHVIPDLHEIVSSIYNEENSTLYLVSE